MTTPLFPAPQSLSLILPLSLLLHSGCQRLAVLLIHCCFLSCPCPICFTSLPLAIVCSHSLSSHLHLPFLLPLVFSPRNSSVFLPPTLSLSVCLSVSLSFLVHSSFFRSLLCSHLQPVPEPIHLFSDTFTLLLCPFCPSPWLLSITHNTCRSVFITWRS